MDASQLHQQSIVIDATCPLATMEDFLENYRNGGSTAIAPTVGYGQTELGTLAFAMKNIGMWYQRIRSAPDRLMLVTGVDDIHKAKETDRLGIIFHFQGSRSVEEDLNNLESFYRLGVRVIQLCYNTRDLVGCGCAEEDDTGLTDFGRQFIAEMNRLGMVVDCAHTGERTTRDALAASTAPVIVSHGNARAVCANKRNLPDDLIRDVAAQGGVVGINGYPAFVSDRQRPTLDDLLDHVDHMADLCGSVDPIGVGIDYFEYQAGVVPDETAQQIYDYLLDSGSWKPGEYPPPPWHWPVGIEMPEKLGNLTAGLLARGYAPDDVEKILGKNFMRVYEAVWKI